MKGMLEKFIWDSGKPLINKWKMSAVLHASHATYKDMFLSFGCGKDLKIYSELRIIWNGSTTSSFDGLGTFLKITSEIKIFHSYS